MNDRPNIHGQSLIGLLENEPEDRIVFAQAHEAVGVPCLMARQGKYKYTYIHSTKISFSTCQPTQMNGTT